MSHPQVKGPITDMTTELVAAYDYDKSMWIINANTIEEAVTTLSFNPCILKHTDEQALWRERIDAPTIEQLLHRIQWKEGQEQDKPRWAMIQAQIDDWTEEQRGHMNDILFKAGQKLGAKATIVAYCNATQDETNALELKILKEMDWGLYEDNIKNTNAGGYILRLTPVISFSHHTASPNDGETAQQWKTTPRKQWRQS
jgi:hypothetical protein